MQPQTFRYTQNKENQKYSIKAIIHILEIGWIKGNMEIQYFIKPI
jgi:poly-D-alanine transfer protein DltD